MSLSGRPLVSDLRREHTIFLCARGVLSLTHHGRSKRWLDANEGNMSLTALALGKKPPGIGIRKKGRRDFAPNEEQSD